MHSAMIIVMAPNQLLLFRAKRGSHSGPGCTYEVPQISKISLSATRATQASLCSLSTVDQDCANLLPIKCTKPCNASTCLSAHWMPVLGGDIRESTSLKARTPLSVVAPISLLLTDWLTIGPFFEHVKLTS